MSEWMTELERANIEILMESGEIGFLERRRLREILESDQIGENELAEISRMRARKWRAR